ncbi:uncharacterized protein ARMOST_18552 [Armillaria ostoyae]|uniref:Uncharacterized protein n=1 Tax=Armillaria ostoyae TaxID=47428 RepID=A0A284S215_ARMOS|nr:uncharacterized protein ARMOST_18552 [Armillaria ostoyae]
MKPTYSHTPDGHPLSRLAELEELILKFGSLLQGLERWQGRNSRTLCLELMTDWSKRHMPPIAIAIPATVANLSSADGNAYILDVIVDLTVATRPQIPHEWLMDMGIVGPMLCPSHLYGEHLVLISPGFLTVGEYERYGCLDWVIPKGQSNGSSAGGQSEAVARSRAALEEQKRRETEATESMIRTLRDIKIE